MIIVTWVERVKRQSKFDVVYRAFLKYGIAQSIKTLLNQLSRPQMYFLSPLERGLSVVSKSH